MKTIENIWEDNWQQVRSSPEAILYNRFADEAYAALREFIGSGDARILEAGCGTGRFCCRLGSDLVESEILGLDISPQALAIAQSLKTTRQLSNVAFVHGDLFHLPFPDESFDVVFNEGVIEHFSLDENPSYEDALAEMLRVTRHGGKVVVAVPNWHNYPHTLYKWALAMLDRPFRYGYEKSFTREELRHLFTRFGLQHLEYSGFYSAHGLYRLSGRGVRRIYRHLGKIPDIFRDSRPFQNKYGFEIVIKGEKP
jgi:ubiquinone/menaquinone biosynthesis C-methylase UbiE